jgi:hypothetical protein
VKRNRDNFYLLAESRSLAQAGGMPHPSLGSGATSAPR